MPLRSIAFLLYFCGSSAAALAVPMAGVLCYVLIYHVYPQSTWWGKALQPFGIRYSFICGVCLLIGAVLNAGRLRFGKQFLHPIEWSMLLILLAMLVSTVAGGQWDHRTDFVIDKMTKVFLFVFLMTHVVVTRKRVWQLVLLLTAVVLYLGHEAKNAPMSAFTNNRLDGIGGPDFRESAGLAIHLIALLPFVAVVLRQKPLWMKTLALFAAIYGVNGFLLCRARSAFLAGIIAAVLAIWYVPKRHRGWVVLVLVLAVLGGVVLSDTWFWDRMETIVKPTEERDSSAAFRLVIWQAAWEMVKANPLGVGVGQFRRHIGRYAPDGERDNIHSRDAHSTFVLCAGEIGVFGLGAMLLTIFISWRTLSQLDRYVRKNLQRRDLFSLLIFASRLSIVVYVVGGVFVSRFYTEGMWILLAMPVCLSRAIENEARVEAKATACIEAEEQQISNVVGGDEWPELATT